MSNKALETLEFAPNHIKTSSFNTLVSAFPSIVSPVLPSFSSIPLLFPFYPIYMITRRFFPALDGIRTLATLWIILFHTLWFLVFSLETSDYKTIFFDKTPRIIRNGMTAVEYFFILTGFLTTQPIFSNWLQQKRIEQENEQKITTSLPPSLPLSFFNFTVTRLSRLYPLLFIVTSIIVAVKINVPDPPSAMKEMSFSTLASALATLTFTNNMIPFAGSVAWTWSLAVQTQVVLALGLILKFYHGNVYAVRNVAFFAIGLSTCYRVIAWHYHFHTFPDSRNLSSGASDLQYWLDIMKYWYGNTVCRMGPVFMGVLVAYYSETNAINAQSQVRGLKMNMSSSSSWMIKIAHEIIPPTCLGVILFCVDDFQATLAPTFWECMLSAGGIFNSVSNAIIVYAILEKVGVFMTCISYLLSGRFWSALAYPTYAVFLFHPLVIVPLYQLPMLQPLNLQFDKPTIVTVAMLLFSILAWIVGYIMTRFIEEPIKNSLRSWVKPQITQYKKKV